MKLTFRSTGIPTHIKKRAILLMVLFVVCLVFFEIIFNLRQEDEVSVIATPTLPIVSVQALGHDMCELHGYVNEMDASYMRDAVIPLDSTRHLPVIVNTYDTNITDISYEIRSLDTSRKIAETPIENYRIEGARIYAEPVIETLVEAGNEYLWILTLTVDDRPVHYYARILLPVDSHENECLKFALDFHDAALSGNIDYVIPYMETNGDEETDTLGHVNIKSSYQQVCWQGFDGVESEAPLIEFKDISSNYNAIELKFRMSRNTDGYTQYYDVREYYKIKYTDDVMYLLDYERSMDEILQPRHTKVTDQFLTLGIISGEDPYISNETGSVVAFVQAGALYEYNKSLDKLVRIFDFRGNDLNDKRTGYDEHGIRLLNIDETGAVDFVVYGYMNTGAHEGECGIDLYHYDSTTNLSKEQAFLASEKSYQILGSGFSELLYRSEAGDFYIMVDGTLLHVDLTTMQQDEMLSDMSEDQYAVASSSRYIAWIEDEIASDAIKIMDLENESITEIKAESGEKLRVLAFMDDDLVYGRVKKSDIAKGLSDRYIYPMYKLLIESIEDPNGNALKTYEKSGYYVTDVTKQSYTLYLDRVQKAPAESGINYLEATPDTIMNSSGEHHSSVPLTSVADETLGSISMFVLSEPDEENKNDKEHQVKLAYSGLVITPDLVTITADTSGASIKYYVYVGSRVVLSGNDLVKAVKKADEEMGIVVDNKQQYLWKRGRALYRSPLNNISYNSENEDISGAAAALLAMLNYAGETADVKAAMMRGESPYDILRDSLSGYTILDLTGATVSEILYYVYLGEPVYAKTGSDSALLIVGYDAANVMIYDPLTNEITRMSSDDADEYFNSLGNVFLTYIENER